MFWRLPLRAYLPVFLWMLVIYLFSTDIGSTRNSGRIIGPIVRFFYPAATDQTIRHAQMVVRKSGHITEYGILAVLMWRSRCIITGKFRRWTWPEFALILLFCVCYAAADEWHQTYVATRQGTAWDVLIDGIGAVLGLALIAIRWKSDVSSRHG